MSVPVIPHALTHHLANALRYAAMDLAQRSGLVDDFAEVIDRHETRDAPATSLGINLDLAQPGAAWPGRVHPLEVQPRQTVVVPRFHVGGHSRQSDLPVRPDHPKTTLTVLDIRAGSFEQVGRTRLRALEHRERRAMHSRRSDRCQVRATGSAAHLKPGTVTLLDPYP